MAVSQARTTHWYYWYLMYVLLQVLTPDIIKILLSGKYAFFANKEYIIYRLQRILPIQQAMDIVDTKTDFLQRGIGFGLQKRSPYKLLFNHVYVSRANLNAQTTVMASTATHALL